MAEVKYPFLLMVSAFLTSVSTLVAGESPQASSPPEPVLKRFHLRVEVGAAYRTFGDITFDTRSRSAASFLPSIFTTDSLRAPYGSRSGFADRRYDDGFVFRDINTATPAAFLPGATAFWGYQSNSQAQGDALFFHGHGTSSSLSERSDPRSGWTDGNNASASPVLQISLDYPISPTVDLGASLGFLFASVSSTRTATTFQARYQPQALSVTDTYALNGLIPPLAPYAGLFDPLGPAPLINNVPSRRSEFVRNIPGSAVGFANQVHESLDLDLYTFSLGPTLRLHRGRLEGSLSTGMAFNIADWEANSTERLIASPAHGRQKQIRRWQSASSGLELLPGFFLQTELGCRLSSVCSVSAFGRYDWTETLHEDVGSSSISMNLDGFTVGGSINFTF